MEENQEEEEGEAEEDEIPVRWLIGQTLDKLSTDYFPTNGEILRFYFYQLGKTSLKSSVILSKIADIIIESWNAAQAFTKPKRNIVRMLNGLVKKYIFLAKSKSQATILEEERRKQFCVVLQSIFDAKCNGIDNDTDKIKDRKRKREVASPEIIPELGPTTWINGTNTEDPDYALASQPKNRKTASAAQESSSNHLKKIIESPAVTSVMDRMNISDRVGIMMIGTVASAMGENLSNGTLSRSALRRHREKNRNLITENIRSNEDWKIGPLIIHWDGKKLPNSTNSRDPKNKIERHGVTVTGN
jgi:hypothetical protein